MYIYLFIQAVLSYLYPSKVGPVFSFSSQALQIRPILQVQQDVQGVGAQLMHPESAQSGGESEASSMWIPQNGGFLRENQSING